MQKKLYKLSKWGEGGGNLVKIQKNSSFFRDAFPYSDKLQSAQILIRRVDQKFALIGLWAFLLISGLYIQSRTRLWKVLSMHLCQQIARGEYLNKEKLRWKSSTKQRDFYLPLHIDRVLPILKAGSNSKRWWVSSQPKNSGIWYLSKIMEIHMWKVDLNRFWI